MYATHFQIYQMSPIYFELFLHVKYVGLTSYNQ